MIDGTGGVDHYARVVDKYLRIFEKNLYAIRKLYLSFVLFKRFNSFCNHCFKFSLTFVPLPLANYCGNEISLLEL
jgi:hypothetical protein